MINPALSLLGLLPTPALRTAAFLTTLRNAVTLTQQQHTMTDTDSVPAVAGETELRRFQVPAIRISNRSPCVVLVIQRSSSWSIYGADEDGIQLSEASMTILVKAIVKYSNDADFTV